MTQTIDEVLAQLKLYTDDTNYKLLKLHPRAVTLAAGIAAEVADPFVLCMADKDEVTLVIAAERVADFSDRLRDHVISDANYRLITIDVALDPSLVGFMAKISAALASGGVSLLAFSAFSRDHLLIPSPQFDRAWQALEGLKL